MSEETFTRWVDPNIEEKDREIERLKELCDKYEKEHKTTYEIWKKDIMLYNSVVDRIDKAIEYIEQHILATETEGMLLNILKGEDKE